MVERLTLKQVLFLDDGARSIYANKAALPHFFTPHFDSSTGSKDKSGLLEACSALDTGDG
jgi:hypothetical protein